MAESAHAVACQEVARAYAVGRGKPLTDDEAETVAANLQAGATAADYVEAMRACALLAGGHYTFGALDARLIEIMRERERLEQANEDARRRAAQAASVQRDGLIPTSGYCGDACLGLVHANLLICSDEIGLRAVAAGQIRRAVDEGRVDRDRAQGLYRIHLQAIRLGQPRKVRLDLGRHYLYGEDDWTRTEPRHEHATPSADPNHGRAETAGTEAHRGLYG